MLPKFWQKYVKVMNVYMLCTWTSYKHEYLNVKYEAYAWCIHDDVMKEEKYKNLQEDILSLHLVVDQDDIV